jgi:hypothetical protein
VQRSCLNQCLRDRPCECAASLGCSSPGIIKCNEKLWDDETRRAGETERIIICQKGSNPPPYTVNRVIREHFSNATSHRNYLLPREPPARGSALQSDLRGGSSRQGTQSSRTNNDFTAAQFDGSQVTFRIKSQPPSSALPRASSMLDSCLAILGLCTWRLQIPSQRRLRLTALHASYTKRSSASMREPRIRHKHDCW